MKLFDAFIAAVECQLTVNPETVHCIKPFCVLTSLIESALLEIPAIDSKSISRDDLDIIAVDLRVF